MISEAYRGVFTTCPFSITLEPCLKTGCKKKPLLSCGIIGYAGHRPAVPVIIEGLRRLEYRGYDSAGVGFIQGRELKVIKAEGKLAALEEKLAHYPNTVAMNGIGHTRWATHGVPAERNAHPHIGGNNELAIIHNGIIENFQELKETLLAKGYVFKSETDT